MTYTKAVADWLNDKEVLIQLKTLPAPKVLRFNMIAYEDTYHSQLLGNWSIEVYCFSGYSIYYYIKFHLNF